MATTLLKLHYVSLRIHVHPPALRHLASSVDKPSLRATLHRETNLARVSQHPQNLHRRRFNRTLQQMLRNVSVDLADNLPRRQAELAVCVSSPAQHTV